MKLTAPIAALLLAAALLAGCGSSGEGSGSTGSTAAPDSSGATAPAGATAQSCETRAVDAEALRATGLGCDQARQVMFAWQRAGGCAPAAGASRSGCTVRSFRCLATVTGKGVAVSCARPGRSLAFIARRG